ncbi:shikimate kinase AroK [Marinibactrum halimedae]|uniref:shikimate kinase AroK n=1 Tax=Marinibactrum halimedae TaxID=1444977 RepID=UPI0024E17EA0|nr:shikimate kinase AroK [Marinibactrum halimedae]
MADNIILVGPMGVGKSTIGRILASLSSREFKDTDHVIEARTGANIPWIFDVEGEEGFRTRESSVLKELVEQPQLVIATGGGIVTQSINRSLLQQQNCVVYLTASLEDLIKRTCRDKKRPLLQVGNPEQRIKELMSTRDPLYREVCSLVVSTESKSPKQVAEKIIQLSQQL